MTQRPRTTPEEPPTALTTLGDPSTTHDSRFELSANVFYLKFWKFVFGDMLWIRLVIFVYLPFYKFVKDSKKCRCS